MRKESKKMLSSLLSFLTKIVILPEFNCHSLEIGISSIRTTERSLQSYMEFIFREI